MTGPSQPRALGTRELLLWLALWAGAFLLRFVLSPDGLVAEEELHTPTVAALLAGTGELWRLLELQYTEHCGGCTAEALLVLPAFAVVGPSLLVWKLVPLGFGLAILWQCLSLAARLGGAGAARIAGAGLILGPAWWTEGQTVAFGSHFEVMALVLGALLLWPPGRPGAGPTQAALCGLLLGLAAWFHPGSLFAPPVLGLLWLGARLGTGDRARLPREGLAALGGFLLGLLPRALTKVVASPEGGVSGLLGFSVHGQDPLSLARGGPGLLRRLDELVGPVQWVSAWHPVFGLKEPLPGLVSVAVCLGALGVVWALALQAVRGRRKDAALLAALALLPLVYAACYLWLAPASVPQQETLPLSANDQRYLLPLVPLVACCLGVAGAWLLARGGAARDLATVALVAVLGVGLTAQLAAIDPAKARGWGPGQAAVDFDSLVPRARPSGVEPDWMRQDLVDPEGLLVAQLEALPRSQGHARSLALGAVGYHVVGPTLVGLAAVPGAPGEGVFPLLDTLPPGDLEDLARGVTLLWLHLGGWLPAEGQVAASPALASTLARSSPPVQEALSRQLVLRAPVLVTRPWRRALEGGRLETHDEDAWAQALAFGLGAVAVDEAGVPIPEPVEGLIQASRQTVRVPPHLQPSLMRGAGWRLGQRLGPGPANDALAVVSPEVRAVVVEGWGRGARRSGWR